MGVATAVDHAASAERHYVALARLARGVGAAADLRQLAAAAAGALADPFAASAEARLWAVTSEGVEDVARHPADGRFPPRSQRELQRAAHSAEPIETPDRRMLVGLHSAGLSLGVLEVGTGVDDPELLADAGPVVACGFGLLAAQGVGDVLPSPVAVDGTGDVGAAMAAFACEAKRLLDHDRLSAYLLTADGRAFERVAVATSAILPGEGIVIPFEDIGLRHVVMTNRPLVSPDLGSDPRIVGREDRTIAAAGFHGLISVPLRLSGRPFGVLNFVSRSIGFYGREDIPLAEQIADQVAAFISHLRAQERMRTLVRHEATETERARLARDVYQVVATTVPAIDSIAEGLGRRLAATDAAAGEQAGRVRELVRLQLAEIRRAVADLAPQALESHTLAEAIEAALGGLDERRLEHELEIVGDTSRLSNGARRAAFRIFQEALTNARVHAGARRVRVRVALDRDLLLVVADDGVGFDPEAVGAGATGLQSMRERARALGGMLNVESRPGAGTTVSFRLLGAGEGAAPPPEEASPASAPDEIRLRVFVTQPNPLLRAGLISVLEGEGDIRVVGQAPNCEEARGQLQRLHPDLVLLEPPLGDAAERAIAEVKTRLPGCAVLLVADRETGRETALVEAGASGVVPKSISGSELADTVRAVVGGARVSGFAASAGDPGGSGLSARERAVLALMTAGLTNAEIGAKLFLATKTVERQVATIVRKLGARNRAHAGAIAVARHLVELSDVGD